MFFKTSLGLTEGSSVHPECSTGYSGGLFVHSGGSRAHYVGSLDHPEGSIGHSKGPFVHSNGSLVHIGSSSALTGDSLGHTVVPIVRPRLYLFILRILVLTCRFIWSAVVLLFTPRVHLYHRGSKWSPGEFTWSHRWSFGSLREFTGSLRRNKCSSGEFNGSRRESSGSLSKLKGSTRGYTC